MTARQKILKAIYPFLSGFSRLTGHKSGIRSNLSSVNPPISVYSFSVELINGSILELGSFKGKKMLLINTASDCGFTGQYEELQELHEKVKNHTVLIGFPSNDFKGQEPGTDEEIAAFCKLNYGVTFLLARKSIVSRKQGQHPVFHWLSHKSENGWNNHAPDWNFCKYLVDEEGKLKSFFSSSINPLSEVVQNAIHDEDQAELKIQGE